MVSILPFRGLRPRPNLAKNIVSLPYDVMDRKEARLLAKDNPLSFLRIIRSDLEFPDEISPYSHEVYKRAKENLDVLIQKKSLFWDENPSYYIYRLNDKDVQQTGLAALFSAKDYQNGRIKKHELTIAAKEADRIQHIQHVKAYSGPVFLLYRDENAPSLRDQIDDYADREKPLYNIQFPNEVRHRLYRIDSINQTDLTKQITQNFLELDSVYIADGHHRAASGARVALEREASEKNSPNAGYFLAAAFPSSQVRILPYYRAVIDLNGFTEQEWLQVLASQGIQVKKNRYEKLQKNQANMYLSHSDYSLEWDIGALSKQNLLSGLAMSVFQERVLSPLLDIADPRTSDRIDFIGGIHGESELKRLVQKEGKFAAAFALPAVSTEDLLSVADSQQIMPPKSTWFEPKLRSGFVSHSFSVL